MAELSVKYLGLNLKNPIIAGSSGLTRSITDLERMQQSGVAAVVLKSLFEEQIFLDADYYLRKAHEDRMLYLRNSETFDYIDTHVKTKYLSDYTETIKEAKNRLQIPVIASVNCTSASGWTSFASKLQDAGADALELNIALQAFNPLLTSEDIEQMHIDIINKVHQAVTIPVAVKISPYFADLSRLTNNLAATGIKGLVMFNRFFSPDINIDNLQVMAANMFSTPAELPNTLRWIAAKAGTVPYDLCASTGVHSGRDVVKMLLAGAAATQVVSTLYHNGLDHVATMLQEIESWMLQKGDNYIDQFAGKMSQFETGMPESYERIQFMRYYSQVEKTS